MVEDEQDIAALIKHALERSGDAQVDVVGSGDTALRAVADHAPDLVILDVNLPVMSGTEVCRLMRTRPESAHTPIIMLTARTSEADRVAGLDLGADDYVTKPFGVLELLARVGALLRRTRPAAPDVTPAAERFGEVELDMATRSVRRNGSPVALTPMEFDLLVALLRRKGAVASRIQLLAEVWGHSSAVLTRTVDTHIGELRRKLEPDPANPKHILTVRKAGYRLQSIS